VNSVSLSKNSFKLHFSCIEIHKKTEKTLLQDATIYIHLGAQWIHGTLNNPVYDILNSIGEVDNNYICKN
jgi:hypothetical protein